MSTSLGGSIIPSTQRAKSEGVYGWFICLRNGKRVRWIRELKAKNES